MYEEAEVRPPSICRGLEQRTGPPQSAGDASRGQDPSQSAGDLSRGQAPCRHQQRTGPPQSAGDASRGQDPLSLQGTRAEDRTPQSVGNSSRGQDSLSLQGTLSEVMAPSICRGPKQSTGFWVLGLRQLLPLQLSEHTLLMMWLWAYKVCHMLFNHSPGFGTPRY